MIPSAPAPLDASMKAALRFIAFMLAVLALILVAAMILMLSVDESTDHIERSMILAGLAGSCALLSGLVFWLAHRKSSARPAGRAIAPSTQWQHHSERTPAWTDWLSLLLPAVLVDLPAILLAPDPFSVDSMEGMAVLTVLLDLAILARLVWFRHQWTRIQIDPQGLLIARRNGTTQLLRPGDVQAIHLGTATSDDTGIMIHGTRILRLTTGKDIVFKERMSAPLPGLAKACAAHVNVPVSGSWGLVAGSPAS